MRSKWKGNYLTYLTYYEYFIENKNFCKADRSVAINLKFSNSVFYIYTGMYYVKLKVADLIVNEKFGMFAHTKKIVKHKKKKK